MSSDGRAAGPVDLGLQVGIERATLVANVPGPQHTVYFRWAGSKRFRRAITILADESPHEGRGATEVCAGARARKVDDPHARRILVFAWIRAIYRCWRDGVAYGTHPHGGAQRPAQAA